LILFHADIPEFDEMVSTDDSTDVSTDDPTEVPTDGGEKTKKRKATVEVSESHVPTDGEKTRKRKAAVEVCESDPTDGEKTKKRKAGVDVCESEGICYNQLLYTPDWWSY